MFVYFINKSNCIDGIDKTVAYEMIEQYGENYMAEILLATNTFGLDMAEGEEICNPKARSDEYSEIEVIARVLYAESGRMMDDQMSVANVMYNPTQNSRLWALAVNEATRMANGYAPSWTPSGFTTQRNYRSVKCFLEGLSYSGGIFYFNSVQIYDIYICGYGVIDSYNLLTTDEIANLSG